MLCAAAPGKARTISGTVRDDAGKPVAAKILVSFITWTPHGGGSFSLETTSTKTISANAGGKFTLPVKVATQAQRQVRSGRPTKSSASPAASPKPRSRAGSTSG